MESASCYPYQNASSLATTVCILRKNITRQEQELINAVAEMMWLRASSALQAIGRIRIEEVIADSDLEHAFLGFAASAPVHELSALQTTVTGVRSIGELRKAMIAAHAAAALSLLSQGNDRTLLHVGSCYALFHPDSGLDKMIVDIAKHLAGQVGEMERLAAVAYPEVESDPYALAPDPLHMPELAGVHLAAGCLPFLARGLFDSGTCLDVVSAIVEAAFSGCHWPTWRNFGWLTPNLVSRVLSNAALSRAAQAHLFAVRSGHLFELNSERRW